MTTWILLLIAATSVFGAPQFPNYYGYSSLLPYSPIVPYPKVIPSIVPYPKIVPSVVPYPEVAPYPKVVPSVVPYPEVLPYPKVVPSAVPYPEVVPYTEVAAPVVPYTEVAAPVVPAPVYPPALKGQHHSQDIFGQSAYGHFEPGQRHEAVQDAFGNKIGGFSYYNAEGKLVQTSYIADAAGYRVMSNDLPVAPVDTSVPPSPPEDTPEVAAAKAAHLAELKKSESGAVSDFVPKDTPEVAAAKAAHLAEVEKASGRTKRQAPFFAPVHPLHYPVALPYSYKYVYPPAYPTTHTEPKLTPDGKFIEDTPEVMLAKAHHFAHVAAAKYNLYATHAARTPYFYHPYYFH